MDMEKLTQNSVKLLNRASMLADEYSNPSIEQEHILMGFIDQSDGLIKNVLKQMKIDIHGLKTELTGMIEKLPKIQGAGQKYLSVDVNKVFMEAEKEAKRMKDEYVSVEHIFLGFLKKPSSGIKKLFDRYKIEMNHFLEVLMTLRGNKRVVFR